ncbi:MAG: hypothetical protein NTU41_04450 [Chloroflexi bacterium]|nr:hypothetical protein [Chloroflexota bacterium]
MDRKHTLGELAVLAIGDPLGVAAQHDFAAGEELNGQEGGNHGT